ncbi:MAG: complex I NDUFA9 subunit family protein [Candidatus Omnitrophica bacterium]|nr:complex I NDUFA9 subunit family protein [Candidatus Omnitrophota bacterium]
MILLTGATGFVGSHILKRLMSRHIKVRCVVRSTSNARILESQGIEVHKGDVTDMVSLNGACKGIDTVIHLVGIIKEGKGITFENVHCEGTVNILEESKKSGVKRFIHMSALGTRANAVSRYHKTKWRSEEAVRESGLNYTIFRPSIICGPEDEFVNMFAAMMRRSPIIPVIGSGIHKMQPIYVEDVASSFLNAVDSNKTIGRIYELGGPEALTFNDILKTIADVMGKKTILLHIPTGIMRPVAWLMEHALPNPPVTREQLIMLNEDNTCDISAMQNNLGIHPIPFRDAISTYL